MLIKRIPKFSTLKNGLIQTRFYSNTNTLRKMTEQLSRAVTVQAEPAWHVDGISAPVRSRGFACPEEGVRRRKGTWRREERVVCTRLWRRGRVTRQVLAGPVLAVTQQWPQQLCCLHPRIGERPETQKNRCQKKVSKEICTLEEGVSGEEEKERCVPSPPIKLPASFLLISLQTVH